METRWYYDGGRDADDHLPFAQVMQGNVQREESLVARPSDFGPKNLPVAPLLATEVLSPSTRLYDLNTKRSAYEKMGVPSYWIVDPNAPGALTVFELDDAGRYQQVAHVEGDAEFDATRPFPVTIVPARLLDKLPPG